MRSHRVTLALALGFIICPLATAQDVPPEIEPMRMEGSAPWGTITRVMEPEYPQALKDAKAKIFVDVSGRVNFLGRLVDVIYTPGSDEAKLIVPPLQVVMEHWRFVPPKDRLCQPVDRIVRNRIWFDFDEERPKLSVTHAPEPTRKERSIKPLTRVDPKYPRSMQVQGWQSYVFTRVEIDAEGKVADVIATAYPREEKVDLSDFEKASIRALKMWTFNPEPGTRQRFACWDIFYRLRP